MEFVANFILNNDSLDADFDISEVENFDALFEIYAGGVTWGNISGNIENQTDLQNALSGLSDDIGDLSTTVTNNYNELNSSIDSNHQAISNINSTIQGYGDIVTYNASYFATSAQGALADTALQPGDVKNNRITIQKNGSPVGDFTLNQANDEAININVPTTAADVGALPDTTTINDLTTTAQQEALNSGANTTNIGQISANAQAIQTETTNRENADNNLQSQIDAITAASDVTDIVGTYAELQAYDTTNLPNNSIIKVLQDESRDDETTYYRWVITGGVGAWVLIGEEGPYYTKSESDSTFVPQTRTVNGKALSSNINLDASDVGALPDSTVIPTVNNATLTIQKNGANVQTFTANASSDVTANITVPTDTSDLTNGAGFITAASLPTVNNGTLTIQANGTTVGTFTANQSGNTTANIVVPDSATWGNITGNILNQTDLQNALNGKMPFTDLGTISLEDYDYDYFEYIKTLTDTGNYCFTEDMDGFSIFVLVQHSGDGIYQYFWSTEEYRLYYQFYDGYEWHDLQAIANNNDIVDLINGSCVKYNANQGLSTSQKTVARNNIEAMRFKDLGNVELQDYNYDAVEFIQTLTETGSYTFVDSEDGFNWFVVVQAAGEQIIQYYWSSEELDTIKTQYFDGSDWSDITMLATRDDISSAVNNIACVKYTKQTLTDVQQTNARNNISAERTPIDLGDITDTVENDYEGDWSLYVVELDDGRYRFVLYDMDYLINVESVGGYLKRIQYIDTDDGAMSNAFFYNGEEFFYSTPITMEQAESMFLPKTYVPFNIVSTTSFSNWIDNVANNNLGWYVVTDSTAKKKYLVMTDYYNYGTPVKYYRYQTYFEYAEPSKIYRRVGQKAGFNTPTVWQAWKEFRSFDEVVNYVDGEINNGTLTITQNGSTLGTFTANQSTNTTINIPGGGNVEIDDVTITQNIDDELQTVAVIDDNGGSAIKTWTGTRAEYDAIVTKDADTLYNITDDIDEIVVDLASKADIDGSNMVSSVKNFDGGWVHSMSYLINSTTSLAAQTSRSFDLSSYLPNDGYQYEVVVSVTGTTSTTSGQTFNTWFKSDIFTNTYSFVGTRVITRTSSSMNSGATVAIPVGTGRSIAIYNGSSTAGSITELWLSGYRRIGTNQ